MIGIGIGIGISCSLQLQPTEVQAVSIINYQYHIISYASQALPRPRQHGIQVLSVSLSLVSLVLVTWSVPWSL